MVKGSNNLLIGPPLAQFCIGEDAQIPSLFQSIQERRSLRLLLRAIVCELRNVHIVIPGFSQSELDCINI